MNMNSNGTSAILCICLYSLSVKKIDSKKPKSPSNFLCSKFSSSFLFILLYLSPHLYCQEISLPLFSVQFLFSSFLLFLVFTLMPFQIVLLISSCGQGFHQNSGLRFTYGNDPEFFSIFTMEKVLEIRNDFGNDFFP